MTNTELEETNTTIETNDEKDEKLYDKIVKRLEPLSTIKFAAYRVACKIRVIQKYLKLTYVDYNILVRVFNTHQLPFGIEKSTISYDDARKVLIGIYELISTYHFNEATMDEIIETLLKFFCEILQINIDENFDLNSFKILLFAFSNAKLPEKYRCFFRQITSPNVIGSQTKLTELFEILLKIPNHFDNVDSFHADNIPGCVQSCLDHTHDGIVREDLFVNWMSREPQTLVWLPTLHRLIATETVRHEARCDNCKAYPVIGMRYRCLRCFNYDLCQTCFFTGDHAKKHDGSHPIEEYCKQVTPFEDLKAFMEFVKLKMGKKELRRKERYLTIERSKSFSETPVNSSEDSSSQLLSNGHHSLTRQEQSDKKALLQDIYRPIPKNQTNEINSSHSAHELILPLTGYDNVPHPPEKKKIEIPIKKHQTKDEVLIENYVNINQKKISSPKRTQTIADNYQNNNNNNNNDDDDDEAAPMLMPKQHTPIKKSLFNKSNVSEHYQLPLKKNGDEDDDDYQPPLPPKQRQNTSRAMVYDFIGSELQELRVALAQFDGNASIGKV